MFITLQIDLTKLGKLLRENPEIIKKKPFKDGEHQLLDCVVSDKKNADPPFDLNIKCQPKGTAYDPKWYFGSGCSNPGGKTPTAPNQQETLTPFVNPPVGGDADPLPF